MSDTPHTDDKSSEAEIPAASSNPVKDFWQNNKYVRPLRIAFNVAAAVTSPIWWPTKKAVQFAKDKSLPTKAFTAAALGLYLGAATYGGMYGYVAANDTRIPVMNWPATEGQWKGHIIRFSHKGTFPFDYYEGIIQTSASSRPDSATSDAFNFSVRRFDTDMIESIQRAMENNEYVIMEYRHSRIDQESFDNGWPGLFQSTNHTPHELRTVTPSTQP